MKNKMLGILIPVLAGAAVIGTGFSTWYFVNNSASAKIEGIQANLATASEISTLKLKSGETELDTTKTFTLSLDSTRDEDSANPKGVNLLYKDGENEAITVNDIDVVYKLDASENFDLTVKHPQLTVTVTLWGNLPTFVELGDGWTANEGKTVFTYTFTDADAVKADENTIDVSEFGFKWTVAGEPGSYDAWNQTKTALEDASVTIDYTLAWVAA